MYSSFYLFPWYRIQNTVIQRIIFQRDFFCPQNMIGLFRSNLGIFFYCESLVLSGFLYCNLAAHSSIHASFILRRGLTRFHLPENIECRNPSDNTGMRPGCHTDRKHHTHCSLTSVSPDSIPPGTYSWQPQTLPACPPFLSSSSFTWINPLKASFLFGRKHAPFRCESC